jgi:hypothetical protein
MTVIHCEYFKVRCDSTGVSCEQCVVRTWAIERDAARARIEARRRARVEEGTARAAQAGRLGAGL